MVYYRIKKEFDQKRRKDGQIYIANELYTAHEKSRLHIPKVYFAFGARFAA